MNRTSPGEAGKPAVGAPRLLAQSVWPPAGVGEDPWAQAKAARWMSSAGQAVLRAGLLVWRRLPENEKASPRERAILVTGVNGSWPDWLGGKTAEEVARGWRVQAPLWLLGGLPNLPAAQLAIEIGAMGPVESRRRRVQEEGAMQRTLYRWQLRGVKVVLGVDADGESAQAEVWSL